jgi:ketol-acid reductoisomerase
VGLRKESLSSGAPEAKGFSLANGTLGEMYQVIAESDLNILLISDAAQAECYEHIFEQVRFTVKWWLTI